MPGVRLEPDKVKPGATTVAGGVGAHLSAVVGLLVRVQENLRLEAQSIYSSIHNDYSVLRGGVRPMRQSQLPTW